jgi:membrane-associated protein
MGGFGWGIKAKYVVEGEVFICQLVCRTLFLYTYRGEKSIIIDMIFSIGTLIGWIGQYRYVILLPIAIVEGPIITIICGFLCAQGQLSWWIVYLIVMLGDLIGDVLWYYLGYRFGYDFVKKWGGRFGLTEKKITEVKEKFHEHKNSILFLSKITNGLGLALVVLFTAGLSKIPFKRYMLINVSGQLIWSGILLVTGYEFGNLLNQIKNIGGKVALGIVIAAACVLIITYVRQLQKKII